MFIVINVMNSFNEHSTSSAGRVINSFTRLWIHQHNKQLYNRTRCIEFTSIFLRKVRKFFNEEFVSISHYISRVIIVSYFYFRKMLYKIFKSGIIKLCFISPVSIIKTTEYSRKRIRIILLNAGHGINNRFTNIFRLFSNIIPMASFWNYKTMIFRKRG